MNAIVNYTEQTKNWNLMLCELHCPSIHGKDEQSDPNIETHFLVYDRFETITGTSYQYLINDMYMLKQYYSSLSSSNTQQLENHPTIRNYHNIISKPNYIKPEIGEYILLPTQEAVAILKTIWLRIVQKKWKKVFAERQIIIQKRCCVSHLRDRENNGNWPQKCGNLPGLKGMLSELKK